MLYIAAELFLVGSKAGYDPVQWFFPALLISRNWPGYKKNVSLVFIAAILLLKRLAGEGNDGGQIGMDLLT